MVLGFETPQVVVLQTGTMSTDRSGGIGCRTEAPEQRLAVFRDFKDTVFTFLRIVLILFDKCMV